MKEQQELQTFTLKTPPGLFTEQTPRGLVYQTTVEQYNRVGQGRWRDGNLVRFQNGLPRKMNGFQGLAYTPDVNSGNIIGVPRSLKKWNALNGQELEAFGTGYKLYVLNNSAIYDITPQRRQTTLTAAFQTTNGSNVVQVVDYGHGANSGDYVLFTGGTAVGGVSFSASQFGAGSTTALIAALQATTGGVALTLKTSPYVMPVPAFITLSSASNFSGINFTIVGTNQETGATQSEVLTGPGAGLTVTSTNVYAAITSITPTTTSANTVSAGFPFAAGEYQITTNAYQVTNAVVTAAAFTTSPLTLTTSPYVMLGAGYVSLTSTANVSAVNFTIAGLNQNGVATTEVLAGPNVGTVTSANLYTNITSITPSAGGTNISAGFYFPSGSAYTFNAAMKATSAATGGGTVTVSYDINAGLDHPGLYFGWGAGTWSQDTWGTPRTSSTMAQPIRLWSLDNWGQDLMASPRGQPVYFWDYNLGYSTKAQNISQVVAAGTNVTDGPPTSNQAILVSQDSQQLVCLGGDHDGQQDPLFIITSDDADYTNFTATATNNVYDGRVSSGSRLLRGLRSRTSMVLFTDLSAYIMTPSGGDTVYNVSQIGENVSLIGPNAACEISGTVYLMGQRKFHMYDGVMQELSCDVWTYVFDNKAAAVNGVGGMNMALTDKIYCWYNDQYSEIWWHYPSLNALECDTYVVFNYKEKHWTYGRLARTAGLFTSTAYGKPIAMDANGAIWLQESGSDLVPVSGPTTALNSYMTSYDFQVMDGAEVAAFSRWIPDMLELVGTFYLTTNAKRYPQDAYVAGRTFTITPGTGDKSDMRKARGKLVNFTFGSNTVGSDWRMGFPSFEVQEDGER